MLRSKSFSAKLKTIMEIISSSRWGILEFLHIILEFKRHYFFCNWICSLLIMYGLTMQNIAYSIRSWEYLGILVYPSFLESDLHTDDRIEIILVLNCGLWIQKLTKPGCAFWHWNYPNVFCALYECMWWGSVCMILSWNDRKYGGRAEYFFRSLKIRFPGKYYKRNVKSCAYEKITSS